MNTNKKSKAAKEVPSISFLAECEGCGSRFQIGASNGGVQITHKKRYGVNGQSIYLTYYDCQNCGRRHFVQIDDDFTLAALEENRKMFVKLAARRKSDKPIHKKQSDKYEKQKRHLRECRIKLMKEFTGVTLYDDKTETSFELRFSV